MTAQENLFVALMGAAAVPGARQYGIPPSITIAQAILESEWGKSELAVKAHNLFGVKAQQGQDYQEFRTAEYVGGVKQYVMADFARYPTFAACFQAHTRLLGTLTRYAPARVVASSPAKFAVALKACGYSTDPDYAEKLMQLMRDYGLTKYDEKGEQ